MDAIKHTLGDDRGKVKKKVKEGPYFLKPTFLNHLRGVPKNKIPLRVKANAIGAAVPAATGLAAASAVPINRNTLKTATESTRNKDRSFYSVVFLVRLCLPRRMKASG